MDGVSIRERLKLLKQDLQQILDNPLYLPVFERYPKLRTPVIDAIREADHRLENSPKIKESSST